MLWEEEERKSVEVRQNICMQKRHEEESAGRVGQLEMSITESLQDSDRETCRDVWFGYNCTAKKTGG